MKKQNAAIITIYEPNANYGNRLQNYAVQRTLGKLGFSTVTYSFEPSKVNWKSKLKYLLQKASGFQLPGDTVYWKYHFSRMQNFEKFNRKYITTKRISKISQIKPADYYVLGSDQVWNPSWYDINPIKKEFYLLTFAEPGKKICFAPSFGIKEIQNEWRPWFQKWLPTFPEISVRETAGAEIVKELTDRDATVLIDPTLLLSQKEWSAVFSVPAHVDCNEPYILTCFLGKVTDNREMEIKRLAEKMNAKVYRLLDTRFPELCSADPGEFLYLIKNAFLILTDSYHACVFSFLFKKPFLAYDREDENENMNARLETLFEKFDLKRKYVNSGLPNNVSECDYHKGYGILQEERQKAMNFLRRSMNR